MKIAQRAEVTMSLTIELTESEARALDALTGYGTKAFLRVFYEHMGKAYLQPHEKGLITLFQSIRETVPFYLSRMDAARKTFIDNTAERKPSGLEKGLQAMVYDFLSNDQQIVNHVAALNTVSKAEQNAPKV